MSISSFGVIVTFCYTTILPEEKNDMLEIAGFLYKIVPNLSACPKLAPSLPPACPFTQTKH
jgi:hypothetical protein